MSSRLGKVIVVLVPRQRTVPIDAAYAEDCTASEADVIDDIATNQVRLCSQGVNAGLLRSSIATPKVSL